MKILVAGYGFVGKAHALALENPNTKVYVYDPALGYDTLVDNPDAVIVCVSTPERTGQDNLSCDINNVVDVIERSPNVPILIKSTISLEGWRTILDLFPQKSITFSPEFLRAEHAMEDFKNQEEVFIGGGNVGFWASILSMSLGVKVTTKDPEELILAKYFRNAFLATKVSFFNQIQDLCEATGVDGKTVRALVAEDQRIGYSHTEVTEERGFGGHCFPKDTNAILATARRFGTRLSLIREAVMYNIILRKPK